MDRTTLKAQLDEYIFDYQYLKAKISELERYDKLIINSTSKTPLEENKRYEEEKMLKFMEKKRNIESTIDLLEQPYKTIMYLKYICFSTFDQIADKMNYSTKRIYQLHSLALDKLVAKLGEKDAKIND